MFSWNSMIAQLPDGNNVSQYSNNTTESGDVQKTIVETGSEIDLDCRL